MKSNPLCRCSIRLVWREYTNFSFHPWQSSFSCNNVIVRSAYSVVSFAGIMSVPLSVENRRAMTYHSFSVFQRLKACTHFRHSSYGRNRGFAFKNRRLFCSSSLNFSTRHVKSSIMTPATWRSPSPKSGMMVPLSTSTSSSSLPTTRRAEHLLVESGSGMVKACPTLTTNENKPKNVTTTHSLLSILLFASRCILVVSISHYCFVSFCFVSF